MKPGYIYVEETDPAGRHVRYNRMNVEDYAAQQAALPPTPRAIRIAAARAAIAPLATKPLAEWTEADLKAAVAGLVNLTREDRP
ncbi:MAG: hypothetical protein HY673_03965 [Chloroflexi bacterium]|nr:hypothetical protein [Chloroflexota bacterium]